MSSFENMLERDNNEFWIKLNFEKWKENYFPHFHKMYYFAHVRAPNTLYKKKKKSHLIVQLNLRWRMAPNM